jgi:hypothetical protein
MFIIRNRQIGCLARELRKTALSSAPPVDHSFCRQKAKRRRDKREETIKTPPAGIIMKLPTMVVFKTM